LIRRKWMSNNFYGVVWSLRYSEGRINSSFGGGANSYSGDHFGRIIWMRTNGPAEPNYQWYFNKGTKSEISLFSKTEYEISDEFTVYGDLQYRYINYSMNGIDDDLKDLGQEHNFGFFNPKAGIFWSLSPDQDAYLSFSVANREPTRSDFKEAAGDSEATPKPERLYDTELGYKLRRKNFSAGINLYGMIYYNQLIPTGELSDVGYPVMTNVENSHRLGIEFNASLRPVSFLGWDLNLTLSRNKILDFMEYYQDYDTVTWDSEYKSRDLGKTDISYSPSITGTSDLNFRLIKRLELHLISKYVGRQYFDNTMSSERIIDPYFVNSLRFDFNPLIKKLKGAEFQVLINNVFNHKYESNAYGGNWYEEGIEKTWSYYFPQAGINFMIKAGLIF
jgi:iron complex outermembrane recepter protein